MARGPFGRRRPFVDPEIEIVFSVDIERDFSTRSGAPRKNKVTMIEKSIKSRAVRKMNQEGVNMGGIEVSIDPDKEQVKVSGGRTNIPRRDLNDGIDILEWSITKSDMGVRSIKISAS